MCGQFLPEQQLLMNIRGKQHNAAASLCRRGYDLAAFVQHGAQQALGLELSPTAVRCIPYKPPPAVLAIPCIVETASDGVFDLMHLTLLLEQDASERCASPMLQP